MRQLKISKQPPDPAWEAKSAQSLPFLQQLAAARPLGLLPAEEARLLRFLIAVARQYRGHGAAWESLLTAGYEASLKSLKLDALRAGEGSRYLAWRVGQRMARLLKSSTSE